MLRKTSFVLLLLLTVSVLNFSASAQTAEETVSVRGSKLSAIALPAGALQIREGYVPAEVKQALSKLIEAGGAKIRQGGSEVFVWSGDYKKAKGAAMIKNLENALQTSGWEYEIGEKDSDLVLFSLFRAEPSRRALVGFFVPSEDGFVFALTEMVRAAAPPDFDEPAPPIPIRKNVGDTNSGDAALIGKWSRGAGSGFIDYTGKTRYKAGETFTFEFFADGTVEYVYDKDVLSIIQCRTKENGKARGTFTVSGDTLRMNLGAMNTVGSSTCDSKDNFKKTEPASVVSKRFAIKKMDSITRPDNPTIMCFDGANGETCFERVKQ